MLTSSDQLPIPRLSDLRDERAPLPLPLQLRGILSSSTAMTTFSDELILAKVTDPSGAHVTPQEQPV
jgi:hypothetical protein